LAAAGIEVNINHKLMNIPGHLSTCRAINNSDRKQCIRLNSLLFTVNKVNAFT